MPNHEAVFVGNQLDPDATLVTNESAIQTDLGAVTVEQVTDNPTVELPLPNEAMVSHTLKDGTVVTANMAEARIKCPAMQGMSGEAVEALFMFASLGAELRTEAKPASKPTPVVATGQESAKPVVKPVSSPSVKEESFLPPIAAIVPPAEALQAFLEASLRTTPEPSVVPPEAVTANTTPKSRLTVSTVELQHFPAAIKPIEHITTKSPLVAARLNVTPPMHVANQEAAALTPTPSLPKATVDKQFEATVLPEIALDGTAYPQRPSVAGATGEYNLPPPALVGSELEDFTDQDAVLMFDSYTEVSSDEVVGVMPDSLPGITVTEQITPEALITKVELILPPSLNENFENYVAIAEPEAARVVEELAITISNSVNYFRELIAIYPENSIQITKLEAAIIEQYQQLFRLTGIGVEPKIMRAFLRQLGPDAVITPATKMATLFDEGMHEFLHDEEVTFFSRLQTVSKKIQLNFNSALGRLALRRRLLITNGA